MSQRRLLLCTDMDRTVIPNGTQSEHPHARQRFKQFCEQPDITLAYVTGRNKNLVQDAIKNYLLPQPDFAITDVGTKIYQIIDQEWLDLEQWHDEIAEKWKGKSRQDLRVLLKDVNHLILQETEKQNTHKLSYYLPLFLDERSIINQVDAILKQHEIEASLVWSIDELKNIGLLDILPSNATKLHAILFLQKKLAFSAKQTVFAGDSGNDMPVLVSAVQSVLVDNASDEIKATAQQQATQMGNQDTLFIAKQAVCGMNANYSAGVLEGVCHFAPVFSDDLNSGCDNEKI